MYDFSSVDVDFFEENGYILIEDFYNLNQDIHPILLDIYKLIGLVAERHGHKLDRKPYSPDNFTEAFQPTFIPTGSE